MLLDKQLEHFRFTRPLSPDPSIPRLSFHRMMLLGNLGFWGVFLYTSRRNFGLSLMKGWKTVAGVSLVGLGAAWELLHEISVESQGVIRELRTIERRNNGDE